MDLVLLKWNNNNNNKIFQEESRLQQATELGNKVVYVLIYKVRVPRSVDAEENSLHKEMLSGSVWLMLLSLLKLIVDFFFLSLWCYVNSTHTHVQLSYYFIPQLHLGLSFVVAVTVICLFALLLAWKTQ